MLSSVNENLKTHKRIKGILNGILHELHLGNYPLSIDLMKIPSNIKVNNIPKKKIIAAFGSLGYSLVQTYYNPHFYKTNAPIPTVYQIFKKWKELQFKEEEKEDLRANLSENSIA